MKLSDFKIKPSYFRKHHGSIKLQSKYKYEVTGPFGTGYNIKIDGKSEDATLKFARDFSLAMVKSPSGNYEMNSESIFNNNGEKILELTEQSFYFTSNDELLLAIFLVNHHFSKKTGPFLVKIQ